MKKNWRKIIAKSKKNTFDKRFVVRLLSTSHHSVNSRLQSTLAIRHHDFLFSFSRKRARSWMFAGTCQIEYSFRFSIVLGTWRSHVPSMSLAMSLVSSERISSSPSACFQPDGLNREAWAFFRIKNVWKTCSGYIPDQVGELLNMKRIDS